MCDRSGARWGRGLLRRGLLRPLTRARKRRPVLARARLLAGVPGTCWPDGLAAHLRLARHPRRVAPDRLLQPQDRSPAGACWIRGTLPRVRRRPRGPARNCAGGRDLVHRWGLKTCRLSCNQASSDKERPSEQRRFVSFGQALDQPRGLRQGRTVDPLVRTLRAAWRHHDVAALAPHVEPRTEQSRAVADLCALRVAEEDVNAASPSACPSRLRGRSSSTLKFSEAF